MLNMSVPLPLTERDLCGGVFEAMEKAEKELGDDSTYKRDCYGEAYPNLLSYSNSKVYLQNFKQDQIFTTLNWEF